MPQGAHPSGATDRASARRAPSLLDPFGVLAAMRATFDMFTSRPQDAEPEPAFTTPNSVRLDLPTMRLRDFSSPGCKGVPVLVEGPFTLHGTTIADYAPGHSLIRVLRDQGRDHVFLTDWKSATPAMAGFAIDTYLADLNVAVDDLGGVVDLVGLCQGGWMALIYAARFPHKVRRLALIGAPVVFEPGIGMLQQFTDILPLSAVEEALRLNHGLVRGQWLIDMMGFGVPTPEDVRTALQVKPASDDVEGRRVARFREWYRTVVDLPGAYYMQILDALYRGNTLARGSFVALGRPVDLADIRQPLYVALATDDRMVHPAQARGVIDLVGTRRRDLTLDEVEGGHLALFIGRRNMTGLWQRLSAWLAEPQRKAAGANQSRKSSPVRAKAAPRARRLRMASPDKATRSRP
jgi:poly(3-hydroxyalkanoate) synthetase